jgi:hypothetical protein
METRMTRMKRIVADFRNKIRFDQHYQRHPRLPAGKGRFQLLKI